MAMWQHSGQLGRSWNCSIGIPGKLFGRASPLFSSHLLKWRTDSSSTRATLHNHATMRWKPHIMMLEQKKRRHVCPWRPCSCHTSPGLPPTGIPVHERKINLYVFSPSLFCFFCVYADELNPNQHYQWLGLFGLAPIQWYVGLISIWWISE